LLQQYAARGDKSWSTILTPKQNKRHKMASYNISKNKKARSVLSAGKVMGNVFWDAEGCILVDFCQKRKPSMGLTMFRS
jgi:hypothetical protein